MLGQPGSGGATRQIVDIDWPRCAEQVAVAKHLRPFAALSAAAAPVLPAIVSGAAPHHAAPAAAEDFGQAAATRALLSGAALPERGEARSQPGFETLNPAIGWDAAKFEVVLQPMALQPMALRAAEGRPWLAGVSSFGFSGANEHAIVAAPPAAGQDEPPGGLHVLALSAKTPEALERHVEEVAAYLSVKPASDLAAIAQTSTCRRVALGER
ncbi:ketoacyl-synthetase C-terminal extension domain-containing protein, partial [Burkholderia gladioli]